MTSPLIFKPHQAIDLAAPYLPEDTIILEAGAFTGHETKRLAQRWPHGTVHSFEPVPELFAQLMQNTNAFSNVQYYPYALSNSDGTAPLFVAQNPARPGITSQASSLHKPKKRLDLSPILFPHTIEVPTITPATWALRYDINRLDFLWLDMQGHELTVLEAMPDNLLATIRVVHTEVSFIESYEGIPSFAHVYAWFERHGFHEIGRDFSNTTDYFFGNILFAK